MIQLIKILIIFANEMCTLTTVTFFIIITLFTNFTKT